MIEFDESAELQLIAAIRNHKRRIDSLEPMIDENGSPDDAYWEACQMVDAELWDACEDIARGVYEPSGS